MRTPEPPDQLIAELTKKLANLSSHVMEARRISDELLAQLSHILDSHFLKTNKRNTPHDPETLEELTKERPTDDLDSGLHSMLPMQLDLFNDPEG